MAQHNDTGHFGEDLAAGLLKQKGYSVLERNWTTGRLEVDIIAADSTDIVFAEVKTRSSRFGGKGPEEYVDEGKQRHICSAADAYIRQKRITLNPRFDIIGITVDPKTNEVTDINHIESAFYPPMKTYGGKRTACKSGKTL